MKLIFCKNCTDIYSVAKETKQCRCGNTAAHYIDELNATYSGSDAVPLGIANTSFLTALERQPQSGQGMDFKAFVIPKYCHTFIYVPDLVAYLAAAIARKGNKESTVKIPRRFRVF